MSSKLTSLFRHSVAPFVVLLLTPDVKVQVASAVASAVAYGFSWLEKQARGHE